MTGERLPMSGRADEWIRRAGPAAASPNDPCGAWLMEVSGGSIGHLMTLYPCADEEAALAGRQDLAKPAGAGTEIAADTHRKRPHVWQILKLPA
ncbi:hypothetical protein [Pannonibacter tanglangensis]|uniref:Uncharacterized protein n=1 Tax=Pannonibacter tanglangensis TaxID=2750084 RepID=A0ABW9ZEQ7_9HYPH|nr:hypothetical protein [Pannonibacter sp. XCT-34]NBN63323.1 hypothetical protein [Pannonibacter sp. XCT-34]